jgi:methyl-accepting chemotaxis protein
LLEAVGQIGDISKPIRSIAAQTHLLALAAIRDRARRQGFHCDYFPTLSST